MRKLKDEGLTLRVLVEMVLPPDLGKPCTDEADRTARPQQA